MEPICVTDIKQEYLKHLSGGAATAAQQALQTKHKEINELMSLLESRLNALTNFHFTPTAPKEELTIVTNAPSLRVEESTSFMQFISYPIVIWPRSHASRHQ